MRVYLCAFFLAFVVGSLAEYWGHRFMHTWFKRAKHIQHHQSAAGQGFLREFWGYTRGSWPIFLAGFCHSHQAGLGFALGGLSFSAFSAYAHELQHQHPECCFWLSQPIHHAHHRERLWFHNFGISCDVWDRVFGTYRAVPHERMARVDWLNLFRIKWC